MRTYEFEVYVEESEFYTEWLCTVQAVSEAEAVAQARSMFPEFVGHHGLYACRTFTEED